MTQYVALPDAIYNTLQRLAEQAGTTPAEWIEEKLPKDSASHDNLAEANPADKHEDPAVRAAPNAWDVLDALTGTVEAPEDWSTEHDHYITGSPKRQKEA